MRLNKGAIAVVAAAVLAIDGVDAFTTTGRSISSRTSDKFDLNKQFVRNGRSLVSVAAAEVDTSLTYEEVNKLAYRELQKECRERGLPAVGITGALRSRLLGVSGTTAEDEVDSDDTSEVSNRRYFRNCVLK